MRRCAPSVPFAAFSWQPRRPRSHLSVLWERGYGPHPRRVVPSLCPRRSWSGRACGRRGEKRTRLCRGRSLAWLRPASRITRFYRDRASRGRDMMRGSGCLAFTCPALSRGPPASAGAAFSAVGLVRGGRQPGLDVAGGFFEPAAAFPRPLPREHRRARLGWPRWLRLVPRSRLVCPECPYRKGGREGTCSGACGLASASPACPRSSVTGVPR